VLDASTSPPNQYAVSKDNIIQLIQPGGCSRWTPGGEEGDVIIGDTTTDRQTARPQPITCIVEFFGLEIGQFKITPIVQPRSFGSGSRRQTLPVG
jgi:hypothetical protein